MDPRALLDHRVILVPLDHKETPDRKGLKARPVVRGRKVPRVPPDLKALLVRKVISALKVLPDRKVHRGILVPLATPDLKDRKEMPGQLVLKGTPDHRALPALKGTPDHRVKLELPVHKARKGHRALPHRCCSRKLQHARLTIRWPWVTPKRSSR